LNLDISSFSLQAIDDFGVLDNFEPVGKGDKRFFLTGIFETNRFLSFNGPPMLGGIETGVALDDGSTSLFPLESTLNNAAGGKNSDSKISRSSMEIWPGNGDRGPKKFR
jgi:hypothetical protein